MALYNFTGSPADTGVVWNSDKRQQLKLVMWDKDANVYKLKNTKNPEGTPIMRRQVRSSHRIFSFFVNFFCNFFQLWKSESGWVRHEYKLFVKYAFLHFYFDNFSQRKIVQKTSKRSYGRTRNVEPHGKSNVSSLFY
jgi:hypothetical protein